MTPARIRFRPLGIWPYPETRVRRSRGTFKAPWPNTIELLERELAHLHAHNVVLQADFTDDDIRLDGWPRANARPPAHPGVILSFQSDHGPLRYATDAHEWWQHNVRAIALGLEALRAVDRYGITRSGEQYRGWNALTAGGGDRGSDVEAAARTLVDLSGLDEPIAAVLSDPTIRASVIRAAMKHSHPDTGGDSEMFAAVQKARRLVEGLV